MTDELIDRVRAADPLPPGSSAPAFESVFAPLTDLPRRRERDGRRRVLRLLGPAVSVAVTASLITAAVLLLHPARTVSHHPAAVDQRRTSHPPTASHHSVPGLAARMSRVMARFAQLEHVTPRELFIANPSHMFPHTPNQTVIPQTVRRAATFTVPGAGRFEFWIARSRKGWLCEAIRQPDGTWAGLGFRGDQFGGPVPGCEGVPWQDKQGFSYYPTVISTRQGGFRIVSGYAPAAGHPVTIRDRLSKATAAIGDGRYFAIVIPLCRRAGCLRRLTFPTHYFQLETLNVSGQVLIRNDADHGN